MPRKGIRIPILMYHSISDEEENGVHPYFWINTSPKVFGQHMKFLKDNHYNVISLSEAVRIIGQVSDCPKPYTLHPTPRYVVLTFDDGFRDFYTNAFPILRQHSFIATVFLPTDYIGNGRPGLRRKEHLTWDEITYLQEKGIYFGSHTCSHPQLHEMEKHQIEHEINRSKGIIEEKTGQCPTSFCYPYKFPEQDREFTRNLQAYLQGAGYECCVSTRIGTVHTIKDIFGLRRIPINSGDDIRLFKAKLEGHYDWIASMQLALKRIRDIKKSINFHGESRPS